MTAEIRTDTSAEAMIAAIEANILDYHRLMGTSGVIRTTETDDALVVAAIAKPSPFRDSVINTRFSDADADARIDETLRGLRWPDESIIWWGMPSSTPKDIGERLLARGFMPRSNMPAMAIDIEQLRSDQPRQGLSIEEMSDGSPQLAHFNESMAAGFEMPIEIHRIFESMYEGVGYDGPMLRAYLGLVDGKPAGTTILVLAGGAAGIYGVAVRPETRRRGIAGALTTRALQDAREMGYRIGVLRASELGEPVYERLGFAEYCRIPQWIWEPATR